MSTRLEIEQQANERATRELAAIEQCVKALATLTVRERPAYGGVEMREVSDRVTTARVLRYLADRFNIAAEFTA